MISRLHVLQHVAREGPDLFAVVAAEREVEVCVTRLDLEQNLPFLKPGDGLLVLGGPMGIGDLDNPQYPWLRDEVIFIRNAINQSIPLVGICLGAQLIAYSAGGSVEPLFNSKTNSYFSEVGWSPINCHKADQVDDEIIMNYVEFPLQVLHWHSDRIILPKSATLLASSSLCKEQFFRVGSYVYGLQCHIEVEHNSFLLWVQEDKEFITKTFGKDATSVLINQENRLYKPSRKARKELITGLFEILW